MSSEMPTPTTHHETETPRTGGDEPPWSFLEPKQFVGDKSIPLPRARLGPGASAALWALRIFVLVVSAMVIYTFVAQL
jgi:hypothetical protein